MRFGWLALPVLLTAPLCAQTSVETGGGVARLEHFSGGAFSSFGGQIAQSYGALQLAFKNSTVQHSGIGTAYRTDFTMKTAFQLGAWEVALGPQVLLARGIEMPSTRTIGGNLGVKREIGSFHLDGEYGRGVAWFGSQRNFWSTGDIGLGTHLGKLQLNTTLHFLEMRDSVPRTDVSFDLRDPRLDTLYREQVQRVQDLGIRLGWEIGRVTVGGQVGQRFGSGTATRSWWVGDIAVRVASSLAITLNSSQTLSDPLLRLHGGQYASLGLRLGGNAGSSRNRRAAPADPLAVEISKSSNSKYTVRFAIPGARNSVTMSGEFSGWKPIALTQLDDGRWEAQIDAGPGLYRMNIRADGGAWAVPPGLRSVEDDFGGVVGLLIISQPQ